VSRNTVRTNGTGGPPAAEISRPRHERLTRAAAAAGVITAGTPARSGPPSAGPARRGHPVPLVAIVGLAAALAGCGGGSSPAGGAAAAPASPVHQVAAPSPASAQPRDACTLVTATELGALGVTGAGSAQKITRGSATVYGCTWGHPPGRELHLQFESLDRAAASQVRVSLGGQGTVVPGVGDVARGQFGSVLAAVNFSQGSTFVAMELFGTGAGGRKGAFVAVAKSVASHV
jgi:hypothetical protein